MKANTKRRFAVCMTYLLFLTAANAAISTSETMAEKTATQPVAIDERNFPDPNFRQFIQEQYDKDSDGALTTEEIASVKVLEIQYNAEKGVVPDAFSAWNYVYHDDRDVYNGIPMDFTGLEQFTSLEHLGIKNIAASNLPLEKFSKLRDVDFAAMPKSSFDFTLCASLEGIGLMNTPLVKLKAPNQLRSLIAPNCQLKEIDLSACRGLVDIMLRDNQLTDIALPRESHAGEGWDFSNNQLTSLDLSETFPESVNISGNPFTEVNAMTLKADDAIISRLEAANLEQCTVFDVSHIRGLQTLSAGPKLADAILIGSQLQDLRLSGIDHIRVIDATTIQAPKDSQLERLNVDHCGLTKLSASQFKNLEDLSAIGNQLQHLNIGGNTNLANLKLLDSETGGNQKLKTIIASRSAKSCIDEMNKAVKHTGGKITYIPEKVTGLKATRESRTALKLRWDMALGASGYKIYDAATGAYVASVSTQNGAKVIYKIITNLKAGEQKKYKVRAYVIVDGTKHYGAYSDVCSVRMT